MEQEGNSFRNLADYNGTRGALQSNTRGVHRNVGARLREEVKLSEKWTTIAGVGVESSRVTADVQSRTSTETYSRVSVERNFFNAAPEFNLIFAPVPSTRLHGRVGAGYGIPGISQLTTTPAGVAGNNSQLDPQRNLGFELGADGRLADKLIYDVVGYYELFYDELVSQSPGSGLSNFTSNAPRADHRGAEATLDFRPWERFSWSGVTHTTIMCTKSTPKSSAARRLTARARRSLVSKNMC
jgi:iron complex outermembrane receptor protein